jgi:hypothetical protein
MFVQFAKRENTTGLIWAVFWIGNILPTSVVQQRKVGERHMNPSIAVEQHMSDK